MKPVIRYAVYNDDTKADELVLEDALTPDSFTNLKQARREAAQHYRDHGVKCRVFKCVVSMEVTPLD